MYSHCQGVLLGFVKCASSPHKNTTAAVAKTGWKNCFFCYLWLWGRYQIENIGSKGLEQKDYNNQRFVCVHIEFRSMIYYFNDRLRQVDSNLLS